MKKLLIPTRAPDQLGKALERARKLKNLSQAELGKRAGHRQATVSNVETGSPKTELATIYALCAALDLEIVVRSRSFEGEEFSPEEFFG